jgi:hypothetical protein
MAFASPNKADVIFAFIQVPLRNDNDLLPAAMTQSPACQQWLLIYGCGASFVCSNPSSSPCFVGEPEGSYLCR